MWRSLVARVVRDDEVSGSNPVIPTKHKEGPPHGGSSFVCPVVGPPRFHDTGTGDRPGPGPGPCPRTQRSPGRKSPGAVPDIRAAGNRPLLRRACRSGAVTSGLLHRVGPVADV